MLNKLTEEQKDYLCELIATSRGVRESMRMLSKRYSKAHKYGEQSFYAYVKSDEGRERIESITAELREKAKTHSFPPPDRDWETF